MSGEHHRHYKHANFCQNPRGYPKFLVDLTRNDPFAKSYIKCYRAHVIPNLSASI